MSAKFQKLIEILKELEKNTAIDGSAVVTPKGQMMAGALHSDIDEKAVAAMSAALSSVGTRVGSTLSIINCTCTCGFKNRIIGFRNRGSIKEN